MNEYVEELKSKLQNINDESMQITIGRNNAYGLLDYINLLEYQISDLENKVDNLEDTITEIEEDYDARIEELQGEIYDLGGSI